MSIKEMVKLANKIDMRLKRFGEVGDPEPSISSLREKAESWRMGEQGIFGTYIPELDKIISNLSSLDENDRKKVYKLRRLLPEAHELWQSGRNQGRKIVDREDGKQYSLIRFTEYLINTCEDLNMKIDNINFSSYHAINENSQKDLAWKRIYEVVEDLKTAFQAENYELINQIADAVESVTSYRSNS